MDGRDFAKKKISQRHGSATRSHGGEGFLPTRKGTKTGQHRFATSDARQRERATEGSATPKAIENCQPIEKGA
jgi:hypothetical protein